jgi:hypothetical protein
MSSNVALKAKLGISGSLVFKDKDGAVLDTMPFTSSVPLEALGLSVEEAQKLVDDQGGQNHGLDD